MRTQNKNKTKAHTHVMVGILINSQDQICISKRPDHKHLGGYWEFPGGKKNSEETCFEALKREFQEEIGVEIQDAEPWFEIMHDYADCKILLDIWLIKNYQGQPKSCEGQIVKMISLDQLGAYVFPEGNHEIVARLLERFDKNKNKF